MFLISKQKQFTLLFLFTSNCTPLDNNSTIPANQTYVTDYKLSSLKFEDGIIQIKKSLDTFKAHGHDDICIKMLKTCESAIYFKPLPNIFRNCIT